MGGKASNDSVAMYFYDYNRFRNIKLESELASNQVNFKDLDV